MVTFINKNSTSSNVGRSTPAERQLINEQSREHRTSARRAHARQRPRSDQADGQSGGSSESLSRPISSGSRQGQFVFPIAPSNRPLTIANERSQLLLQPQPRSGPGNPIDPFQTSSVLLNHQVVKLLRYFKEVYYLSIWTNVNRVLEGKIDVKTVAPCLPETIILECMENRTRMYCLLADAGCHMKEREATDMDLALTRLQLIQRGTESLRADMIAKSPNVDSDVLLQALHLYLAAATISLEDAAQAHMKGVKAIIRNIVRQGVPIRASNAAMLALVDVDLSHRLLKVIDPASLTDPTSPISVSATSFEEIQALPPEERPRRVA